MTNFIAALMVVIAIFASPMLQAGLWLGAMLFGATLLLAFVLMIGPLLIPDGLAVALETVFLAGLYGFGVYCLIVITYEWLASKLKRK